MVKRVRYLEREGSSEWKKTKNAEEGLVLCTNGEISKKKETEEGW